MDVGDEFQLLELAASGHRRAARHQWPRDEKVPRLLDCLLSGAGHDDVRGGGRGRYARRAQRRPSSVWRRPVLVVVLCRPTGHHRDHKHRSIRLDRVHNPIAATRTPAARLRRRSPGARHRIGENDGKHFSYLCHL